MKRVLIFQLLVLVLGSILLWFTVSQQEISSFVSGGLIVAGNFILLGSGLNLVFRKKLFALSVFIIVFKYAILGITIYYFAKQPWMRPYWFVVGVASMMIGSLIYGLTLGFFEDPQNGSSKKEE